MKKILLLMLLVLCFIGCRKKGSIWDGIPKADLNDPNTISWESDAENCYGLSFNFADVNTARKFEIGYIGECKHRTDIKIIIGKQRKIYTATEFFTLLGFDMEEKAEVNEPNKIAVVPDGMSPQTLSQMYDLMAWGILKLSDGSEDSIMLTVSKGDEK